MNIFSKIQNYLNTHKMVLNTFIWIVIYVITFSGAAEVIIVKDKKYQEQVRSLQEAETQIASLDKKYNEMTEMNEVLTDEITTLNNTITECNKEIEALTQENEKLKSKKTTTRTTSTTTNLPSGNYPEATYVHNYLRELGLNDYVVAGILGNIMAEVGGQTLDFSNWQQWSQSTYYGICQWAADRKARLLNDFGSDLAAQCKFLGVELFEVIPQGSSFYGLTDEREAALYFAKVYERCNSKYYSVRQNNATKALNYFNGQ